MEYLYQRNRGGREEGRLFRQTPPGRVISAEGKRVVVVGGGDTGMDCISNALREGAEDVLLLDVYLPLREGGRPGTPWPLPPSTPTTYALDEGGDRRFGTQVTALRGVDAGDRVMGRRVEGIPRATCTPSRAASSRSAPTSC